MSVAVLAREITGQQGSPPHALGETVGVIEVAWAALGMVLEVVAFLVSLFLVLALPGIVVWGISETVDPRDVLRVRWFLQQLLALA